MIGGDLMSRNKSYPLLCLLKLMSPFLWFLFWYGEILNLNWHESQNDIKTVNGKWEVFFTLHSQIVICQLLHATVFIEAYTQRLLYNRNSDTFVCATPLCRTAWCAGRAACAQPSWETLALQRKSQITGESIHRISINSVAIRKVALLHLSLFDVLSMLPYPSFWFFFSPQQLLFLFQTHNMTPERIQRLIPLYSSVHFYGKRRSSLVSFLISLFQFAVTFKQNIFIFNLPP